jgi:glycosyltransferase involved in cell wall biosynthesis
MTISEAGACATPAVASRIAGHVDAVEDDVSGLLADVSTNDSGADSGPDSRPFADSLRTVITDPVLRARLGRGARRRARALSWEATAAGTLDALVDEAVAGKRPGR